jgi:hypothetical protein
VLDAILIYSLAFVFEAEPNMLFLGNQRKEERAPLVEKERVPLRHPRPAWSPFYL